MLMNIKEIIKRKNHQQGFTLVELIIVMAILAILAAIAVPKFGSILTQSKFKANDSNIEMIAKAAEIYWADKGVALASLAALETAGYIDDTKLDDVPYNTTATKIPYTCTITITDGVATLTVGPGKCVNTAGVLSAPTAAHTKTLN